MTKEEMELCKKFALRIVKEDLPAIIDVEDERLPEPYKGVFKLIMGMIQPQLIALLEKKVEEIFAQEVGV